MTYESPILKMSGIDRWVDVDFRVESEATGNACGCLPTPDDVASRMAVFLPIYEAAFPVYPRAQWPDLIAARDANDGAGWAYRRIRRGKNQRREGTCVYNMLAILKEMTWNRQFGDGLWVPLSPMSGYRWNAPGPGTGSNIGASIEWSEAKGLLPENTPENLALMAKGYFAHCHPATGYYEKFAAGWEATAQLFRAMPDERGGWYRVTTVDGWFSALFDGGVCGGGRDRHAIGHCGAAKRGNEYLSIYCNSWGSWGATLETAGGPLTSFGFDSEAKVRTMVGRDGFVLVNMRRPDFLDRWLKALAV